MDENHNKNVSNWKNSWKDNWKGNYQSADDGYVFVDESAYKPELKNFSQDIKSGDPLKQKKSLLLLLTTVITIIIIGVAISMALDVNIMQIISELRNG